MANPFQTPPNEKSFSSLIDDAILATGKPGSLLAAIQHANLAIRECQGLGLFARDLVEDTLTVDTNSPTPFTWTRPPFFRILRTVRYNRYLDNTGVYRERIYPKFAMPGRIQKDQHDYFYAANNYYAFSGVNNGDTIDTAAYYWLPSLAYYALLGAVTTMFPGAPDGGYPIRLAYFDITTMKWMYYIAADNAYATTTGDDDTDAQYRALSANWLTEEWYSLILSGTKAKIWNSVGDPRGNVEYSLYKQVQTELRTTVGREGEGF